MPANPIQKRTRNSFLLGMLIMLLVAVAVIAILYFTVLRNPVTDALTKKEGGVAYAYKLTSSVESGEEIPNSKIDVVEMYVEDLPGDYDVADLLSASCTSKIDLQAGTILSRSLLNKGDAVKDSTRLMEFNMLTLPSNLKTGDYIDVRFLMPSGEDYIVLSRKQVVSLKETTVGLHLTEDEILMMSSAIIESYIMKASNLYANQYVQAGTQKASTPTYSVSAEVYQLIQANSQKGVNIEDYAKINESYNDNLRNTIEQELAQYFDTERDNIEEKMTAQKEKAMSLYLSGLEGY